MRKKDFITLGDIYGQMLKTVKVVEEKADLAANEEINKSKKTPKMSENAFTKKNELKKGGPSEKGGFHKALNDSEDFNTDEDEETVKKPKKKKKEKKITEESRKIARNRLNTFMTKKSTFDKLFESVMGGAFDNQEDAQDVDALGLGDAPTDDEFESEDMGEEGDEVTVTLSRSAAQELLGLLQAAVGEEGEMGEDEFGGEDEGLDFEDEGEFDEDAEEEDDDDEEMSYDEDEERGVHPTDKVGNDGTVGAKDSKGGGQQHKLQQKNNKVNGKPQPKGGGTKVVGTTDKVGNDGDYGHAIQGSKQPDMGKQNKVSDLRQAEDYFR